MAFRGRSGFQNRACVTLSISCARHSLPPNHRPASFPARHARRPPSPAPSGVYAALLVFRNPYIYAVLTILTVLPQNSNVTSLNNLVILFYESGLFMNFAEAVTCVRLVTWLSMAFMVVSFAIFA
jgi:hypothetical protein